MRSKAQVVSMPMRALAPARWPRPFSPSPAPSRRSFLPLVRMVLRGQGLQPTQGRNGMLGPRTVPEDDLASRGWARGAGE